MDASRAIVYVTLCADVTLCLCERDDNAAGNDECSADEDRG